MVCTTAPMVPQLYALPLTTLAMTISVRTFLMRTKPMFLSGLLHHRFPPTHHASDATSHLVKIPLLTRVTPPLRNLLQAGTYAG